jgi:hypothetical protein
MSLYPRTSPPTCGPLARNPASTGSDLIHAFGEALEVRRQIAQMLFDRERRSVAREAPNPGRLAPVVVRRHAWGRWWVVPSMRLQRSRRWAKPRKELHARN